LEYCSLIYLNKVYLLLYGMVTLSNVLIYTHVSFLNTYVWHNLTHEWVGLVYTGKCLSRILKKWLIVFIYWEELQLPPYMQMKDFWWRRASLMHEMSSVRNCFHQSQNILMNWCVRRNVSKVFHAINDVLKLS